MTTRMIIQGRAVARAMLMVKTMVMVMMVDSGGDNDMDTLDSPESESE